MDEPKEIETEMVSAVQESVKITEIIGEVTETMTTEKPEKSEEESIFEEYEIIETKESIKKRVVEEIVVANSTW